MDVARELTEHWDAPCSVKRYQLRKVEDIALRHSRCRPPTNARYSVARPGLRPQVQSRRDRLTIVRNHRQAQEPTCKGANGQDTGVIIHSAGPLRHPSHKPLLYEQVRSHHCSSALKTTSTVVSKVIWRSARVAWWTMIEVEQSIFPTFPTLHLTLGDRRTSLLWRTSTRIDHAALQPIQFFLRRNCGPVEY